MTTEEIVAYLEDKTNATVKEIGTDNPTIYKLEKAGVVRRAGIGNNPGRGRPPVLWALADASKATAVPEPGQKRDKRDMSAAHAAKRKKRVEREKADKKRKQEELKIIRAEIPSLWPKYEKALAEALKKNTTATWNKADQLQNSIIGSSRRITTLEAELA